MSEIVLGGNQYGKAETRVVRIYRDTHRHEIHDVNVTTCLRGDFSQAYLTGDQSKVLPTDTQKQTAYAYAKEKGGLSSVEDYGLTLARHFVHDVEPVEAPASSSRSTPGNARSSTAASTTTPGFGRARRSAPPRSPVDARGETVVGGLKDMVILKSTGSEFAGFLEDRYTVLQPTHDRVMATSLVAQWRFTTTDVDWEPTYVGIKAHLVKQFAVVQSLALQQTLFEMGKAVLEAYPFIAEIRLSAPNKHHFIYDLSPFGLTNDNEVFNADDRPYGLIQATVTRDDAPPPPVRRGTSIRLAFLGRRHSS